MTVARSILRSLRSSAFLPIFAASMLSAAHASANQLNCANVFAKVTAYETVQRLRDENNQQKFLGDRTPRVEYASGSRNKILHSLEKEGLFYEDIAEWFPALKSSAKAKLTARLEKEATLKPAQRKLNQWLAIVQPIGLFDAAWAPKSNTEKLAELLKTEDPFTLLTVKERSVLFEDEILNFDDIHEGPGAPQYLTVGDDIGSYEVRLTQAIPDRNQYRDLRDQTETYLEGKIGHQHLFHGWPQAADERAKIAPQYIELLDGATWFLFWRQMNRNPDDVSSILSHPYLGVYTRASLNRLNRAVVKNEPQRFKNKFRMIGARAFPAMDDTQDSFVTDWELRSGNKGVKRDFVETLVESRLVSGDYSGLRDYRSYDFDPSAPAAQLLKPYVSQLEIEIVQQFEEIYPAMDYSPSPLSNNHIRNRIMSPLLPWGARLDISMKKKTMEKAQKAYAEGLVKIANFYAKKLAKNGPFSPTALGELRAEVMEKLEANMYEFASKARLDVDFERYLTPTPTKYPEITVATGSRIDVNKIPLGIEYSFRFPFENRPQSQDDAKSSVNQFAVDLAALSGTTPQAPESTPLTAAHGHGVAVSFKVADSSGALWRTEWDGIQREYTKEGKVKRAWGGHVEVASPKFVPEQIEGSISDLFKVARQDSLIPSRAAGGGHFNFDLEGLKKMPVEQGTRAVLNLISLFENSQQVILFMWQHPKREFAALPIKLQPGFSEAIRDFKGDWEDLGRLLYENRYFNTNISRKPKYVPLNLTAVMTPILPTMYVEGSLDIKNAKQEWFPSFGNVTKRAEARFFDAPINENMAGLQIKYGRALMNAAFNSEIPVRLMPKYTAEDTAKWTKDPEAWFAAAEAHLRSIGLDPIEFRPLLWDAFLIRSTSDGKVLGPKREYKEYKKFLPAKPAAGAAEKKVG